MARSCQECLAVCDGCGPDDGCGPEIPTTPVRPVLWTSRVDIVERDYTRGWFPRDRVIRTQDLHSLISWSWRKPFSVKLTEWKLEGDPQRNVWAETGRYTWMFVLAFVYRFLWYRLRGRAWRVEQIPEARIVQGRKALVHRVSAAKTLELLPERAESALELQNHAQENSLGHEIPRLPVNYEMDRRGEAALAKHAATRVHRKIAKEPR